jgi:hypothetical protein
MAYNLPAAWDPGYVLPENVRDEGLERRALVTKQMPRGTYDNPSVGTGGYAVPQYVKAEGYGQGTFTTKWQPSGSYNGPAIPAWLNQRPRVVKSQPAPGGGRVVTVQALGDDAPLPLVFDQYGRRAADALLSRVARLPAGQREPALRAILTQVDKSLWSRTQTITKRYLAQGVPLAKAFPEALARALSVGIAAEIIDTGLRRSAPQAQSLLGLGCYGPTAMGAIKVDPESGPRPTTRTPTPIVQVTGTGEKAPPPPPLPKEIMVAGLPFSTTALRAWGIGTPSSTVANRAAPPDVMIQSPEAIPQATIDFLRDKLLTPVANEATRSFCSDDAMTGFPEWDASTWFARLGITCESKMNLHPLNWLRTASGPFARVKNESGGDLVLHIRLYKRDISQPHNTETNPLVLKAWLSRVPDPGFWTTVWKTATWLPMTIAEKVIAPIAVPITKGTIDAVKGGLDKLGELACDLLNTPGVAQAAGAVGATAAGVPPQAGAAAGATGAKIAQGACGTKPPPEPTPPPPPPPTSILPLAILGGAAVIAILLTGK